MLVAIVVSPNAPSLSPRPVKSKRSVAMPASARARPIATAAARFLPQVKQWANRAKARGGAWSGSSRRAASATPAPPVNEICSVGIGLLL
jgi:hypothetical protein